MALVESLSATTGNAGKMASPLVDRSNGPTPLPLQPQTQNLQTLSHQQTMQNQLKSPPSPPAAAAEAPPQQENSQQKSAAETDEPEEPVIDIVINNVVCSFSVGCHLDLKHIALHGANVEYRRENGMVTMKLRRPYTTASMWSSGKITCTGSTSEAEAKVAARRVARYLQKQLDYKSRFINFRVVNVLGTCTMPFGIKIADFSQKYPRIACYEPELHPGVTYRVGDLSATLKVFSTGSITVTAPSVLNVQRAIEHIFPLVYEFRKDKTPADLAAAAARTAQSDLYLDSDFDEHDIGDDDGDDLMTSDDDD